MDKKEILELLKQCLDIRIDRKVDISRVPIVEVSLAVLVGDEWVVVSKDHLLVDALRVDF